MRKLKYVFLLVVATVTIFIGCSKSNQITGPAGAAGSTGVPGGNLVYAIKYATLSSTSLQGSGNLYHVSIWYPYYYPNLTYMVTGYLTKVPLVDTLKFPDWYKMPYTNVYTTTGDQIYCSIGNDTIKVWYYNPSATTFPLDSTITCKLIIIPQQ